jgi:diguanylate cyclase (GGDEF)-like protein
LSVSREGRTATDGPHDLLSRSAQLSPRATVGLALDGTIQWANQAFAELVGRPLASTAGASVGAVLDASTADVLLRWRDELVAGHATAWDADHVLTAAGRRPITMNMSFTALVGPDNSPIGLVGRIENVSLDRSAAVTLARQTDALDRLARGDAVPEVLAALVEAVERDRSGMRCAVLVLDEADGGRLFTAAAPSLPATFSDVIDGTAIGLHAGSCGRAAFTRRDVVTADIAGDPDWAPWRELALAHGVRACWSVPLTSSGRHGDFKGSDKVLGTFVAYFDTARTPTADERREIARTTTLATIALEMQHDEAELRRANLRDPLTGLANRRLFIDELGAALRRARRRRTDVTVLFLDIDHFKVFNDSMGHLVGDEVLRIVANRVQQAVRPHDVVARFGGDEFTIACEGLGGAAEAEDLAEHFRQAIEGPVQVGDREGFLTVSIGIARSDGWESPRDLVANADAAMYQAKARGRAGVSTFDEGMRAQSRDRLHMESALRRGVGTAARDRQG